MGRKQTSPAGDFTQFVAWFPWWLGLGLAPVAYFALHHHATLPMPPTPPPGQIGSMLMPTMLRALAMVGQYVLPFLLLLGAAISAWRQRARKKLLNSVVKSDAADALNDMGWQQFEHLVGEGFRLQGYRVTETGGGGADGGVDLVLSKGTEKFLVQCKQWRALRVGVDVVRQLYGVMAARGAAGGFVVTSGRFTEAAKEFAQGRHVQLVDGTQLQALLRQARAGHPSTQRPAAEASATPNVPDCPVCAKAMVPRLARRGAQAGQRFWGCSAYPACKGTRAAA